MSDKHKDAQGELPIKTWQERAAEFKPGMFRLPPPNEDFMRLELVELRAALSRRASQVSAAAPADERAKFEAWAKKRGHDIVSRLETGGKFYNSSFTTHLWATWQAAIASEGQAQTSAAGIIKPWKERALEAHPRSDPFHWPDKFILKYMMEELAEYRDAAQLADSTAPGGPVDADELHYNAQRLRNVAALVGVEAAFDDATVDAARGALLGEIAFALRRAKVTNSAAPTGQQSLTDGGAVPPIAKVSEHADPASDYSYVQGWNAARKWVIDNAAAPLPPQVQPSEALEDIPNGVYFSASANNFYDMMTKTGMGGDFFMQWRDGCHMFPQENFRANRAGDMSQWLPRVADQQAAQPVADSNGGVA